MSSSLSSLDQENQNFLLRSRCSTAEIAYKNSRASDQECISCVCFTYFQESATSISVLRSLWQAHWLQENLQNQDDVFSWLEASILALEHGFTDFLEQMERAGWDQNQIILKVPKEPVLVSEYLNEDV